MATKLGVSAHVPLNPYAALHLQQGRLRSLQVPLDEPLAVAQPVSKGVAMRASNRTLLASP